MIKVRLVFLQAYFINLSHFLSVLFFITNYYSVLLDTNHSSNQFRRSWGCRGSATAPSEDSVGEN